MLPLNYVVFIPYGFLFFFITIFGAVYSLRSRHWLGAWVGLEINLIAFIPIILYRGIVLETESAIKYFIFQAVGSALIIFRRLLRFGLDFTWDLSINDSSFLVFKGIFILRIGLFLKLGVFPFHMWFPSVIAGLSWFARFLLLTWQKIAPLFLLFFISYMWGSQIIFFLLLIAAGSRLVGGIGGINQTQLRALLAYSSIAHLGWIVFCCFLREARLEAYFGIYFFISLCIFLVIWNIEVNLVFQAFSSFFGRNVIARFSFILFFLSLGGIPPLLGFAPKWMVLNLGRERNLFFILIILIIGSLLRLFYYLSLIFSSFFSSSSVFFKELNFSENNYFLNIILVVGTGLNLFGGLIFLDNFFIERFLYAMGLFNKS